MSDLEHRIKQSLEPVLEPPDPRQRISAYHDMPYALFRYDPEDEFDPRKQVTLLETRLSQKGKRVKRTSPAVRAALQSLLEAPSATGNAKKTKKGKANA
jgi:hypothetical protein